MKKVLMIGYVFPPLGGSGGRRLVKFAKYLPVHGWEPIVLASRSWNYHALDESLWRELPEGVKVCRSGIIDPSWPSALLDHVKLGGAYARLLRLCLVPDGKVGWLPFACRKGVQIDRADNIDAVFSTSWPYTAHLIARYVKTVVGKPWVADFRDEWSEHVVSPTPVHHAIHKRLEALTLRDADRVVASSESIARLLRSKQANAGEKFVTITNGYDEEDYCKSHVPGLPHQRFVLAYVGALWPSLDVSPVLRAVSRLIEDGTVRSEDIELRFVGHPAPSREVLAGLRLQGIAATNGFVSHQDAIAEMRNATILLLVLSHARERVIPEKTFEYLASGRPILAVMPPKCEAAGLVRSAGAGIVVDYDKEGEIADGIAGMYKKWRTGTLTGGASNGGRLAQYERKALCGRLADVLNAAVSEAAASAVPRTGVSRRSCGENARSIHAAPVERVDAQSEGMSVV